jgi:hypothetical protein
VADGREPDLEQLGIVCVREKFAPLGVVESLRDGDPFDDDSDVVRSTELERLLDAVPFDADSERVFSLVNDAVSIAVRDIVTGAVFDRVTEPVAMSVSDAVVSSEALRDGALGETDGVAAKIDCVALGVVVLDSVGNGDPDALRD